MTPTSKTERFINLRERREALHVTQAESVWLTQKRMAELFDVDVRTVNEHLQNIYDSEELSISSTIRNFRIVQNECEQEEITKQARIDELKRLQPYIGLVPDGIGGLLEVIYVDVIDDRIKQLKGEK